MGEYRTIADVKGLPPERVAAAKAVLIQTAVAFCVLGDRQSPARGLLLDRMASVLPDLAGLVDGPEYPVRVAVERLAAVWRDEPVQPILRAVEGLQGALRDLYIDRSDAALARWQANGRAGIAA